jgi:hypothetical protein
MPVSPFKSIVPDVIVLSPLMHLSRELLPDPDGPIIATISPFFTSKLMLFTARNSFVFGLNNPLIPLVLYFFVKT